MRKFEEEIVNSVLHTVASEELNDIIAAELLVPDPEKENEEKEQVSE